MSIVADQAVAHATVEDTASRAQHLRVQEPTPTAEFQPKSISVIFPAYNEEANIEQSVLMARTVMSKFFAPEMIEIIVVNDGSADRTADVLNQLAEESSDLRVIHHARNRGYGAALRSGLYEARHDLVFFSDADLQFDLSEIRHFLKHIKDFDIVAGYRINRADDPIRLINAWGWNKLVWATLGLPIKDIDCAFKLFRRQIFEEIQLTSVGAMVNTELLALAVKRGMKIKELPVSHYPRSAGEQTGANLKVVAKAFRELFSMYRRLKSAD